MTPATNAAGLSSHLAPYVPEYAEVQQLAHPSRPDKYRVKIDDLHHVGLIRSWIGSRLPAARLEKLRAAKLQYPNDPVERAVLWRFARNLEVLLDPSECNEWKRRDLSATGKTWWDNAMQEVTEGKESDMSVLRRSRVLSGLPALGFGMSGETEREEEEGRQAEEITELANSVRDTLPPMLNALQLQPTEPALDREGVRPAGSVGGTVSRSTFGYTLCMVQSEPQSQIVVNFNPASVDLSQPTTGTCPPHKQAEASEQTRTSHQNTPTQPTQSQVLEEATAIRNPVAASLFPPSSHIRQHLTHLTLDIDNFGHHTIVQITPYTKLSDLVEAAFHTATPRVRDLAKCAVLRGNAPISVAKGVSLVIDGWMDHWTDSVWERISAVALSMAAPPVWECEVVTEETGSGVPL